jgi:hypothetical protein
LGFTVLYRQQAEGFRSPSAQTMKTQSANLDRALELWKSDRVAEGELLLRGEVNDLEHKFGRSSLEYEVASGELIFIVQAF